MAQIPNSSLPYADNATNGVTVTADVWNQMVQIIQLAVNDTDTKANNATAGNSVAQTNAQNYADAADLVLKAYLLSQMAGIVAGTVSDGSITMQKLATSLQAMFAALPQAAANSLALDQITRLRNVGSHIYQYKNN